MEIMDLFPGVETRMTATKARDRLKAELDGAELGLAQAMRDEVAAAIDAYKLKYQPCDMIETWLIESAANNSVIIRQLQLLIEDRKRIRVRRAYRAHDKVRRERVRALIARIEARPEEVLRELAEMTEGCELLADRWDGVAFTLERSGRLDPDLLPHVLHLLGRSTEPGEADEPAILDAWRAARTLASPEEADSSAVEAALGHLKTLAEARREAYKATAARLWKLYDGPERDAAAALAMHDDSETGRQIARELAAAERARRRALEELALLRRFPGELPFAPRRRPARAEVDSKPEVAPTRAIKPPPPPAVQAEPPAPPTGPASQPASISRSEPEPEPPAPPPSVSTTSDPTLPEPPKLNRRQRRALKRRKSG